MSFSDRSEKYVNLTNKVFTRLHVIHETRHPNPNIRGIHWSCFCECGNTTIVRTSDLTRGKIKSCGCWHNKQISKHAHNLNDYPQSYGLWNSKIYKRWTQMLQSCYSVTHHRYKTNGKKGITVCDEWRNNPKLFFDWCKSNGMKDISVKNIRQSDGLTICLKKHEKEFSPENCFITNKSKAKSIQKRTKHCEKYDYENMIGKIFDKIEVIDEFQNKIGKYTKLEWLCVCQCGGLVFKSSYYLYNQKSHTCGCKGKYFWSKFYPCCIICNKTTKKHAGKGLCYQCYLCLKKDQNIITEKIKRGKK